MFHHIGKWLESYSWELIGLLALVSVGLGIGGFLFAGNILTDALYMTAQLFTLELGPIKDYYNPMIDVARWLALVVLVSAVLKTVFSLLNQQLDKIHAFRFKNHVIIVGLGIIGERLASDFLQKNIKVVVIDNNPENKFLTSIRMKKGKILLFSGTSEEALRKAGLKSAAKLFLTTDQDSINLDIYNLACTLTKKSNVKPEVYIHIQDYSLKEILTQSHVFRFSDLNPKFINIHELAARKALWQNPVDIIADVSDPNCQPHAVIIGYSPTSKNLIREICLQWHFLNLKKPRITLLDSELTTDKLVAENPYLSLVSDFCVEKIQGIYPSEEDFNKLHQKTPIHLLFCCEENDVTLLSTLSRLVIWQRKQQNPPSSSQIKSVYFTYDNRSITDKLEEKLNEKNASLVTVFNISEQAANATTFLGEQADQFARFIHDQWLTGEKIRFNKKLKESEANGKSVPKAKDSMAEWSELDEEFRRSNRSQGDHAEIKIRALGLKDISMDNLTLEKIEMLTDKVKEVEKNTELFENFAAMEHNRWNADKYVSGYTYDTTRNDNLKLHDNLTHYDNLTDDIKQYDRDVLKWIPELLRSYMENKG